MRERRIFLWNALRELRPVLFGKRKLLCGERMEFGRLGNVFLRNGDMVVRKLGRVFRNLRMRNAIPNRVVRPGKQRLPIPFGNVLEIRLFPFGGFGLFRKQAGNVPSMYPGYRFGMLNGDALPIL